VVSGVQENIIEQLAIVGLASNAIVVKNDLSCKIKFVSDVNSVEFATLAALVAETCEGVAKTPSTFFLHIVPVDELKNFVGKRN